MVRVALVLSGGDPIAVSPRVRLPDADLVVAADSGLALAPALGVRVDRIVGDLDSARPELLDEAVAQGATVERHPVAKDATDLELAIESAVRDGARRVTVVGGGGGRVDHFLANILLLASPRWDGVEMDAWWGPHVSVVHGARGARALTGEVGSVLTLLPVGGIARGIVTAGLEYPLAHEDLIPGTTRGVSNVMASATASVELAEGTLLVVQPEGAS
jgi:thiamine pyrophosphokinase